LIPKLFILGIDGLSGDIVLESDLMPNLKRACQYNEHAIVESPNNLQNKAFAYPHTWPAWTTIWTGMSEEDHGIRMPDRENGIVQTITDQPYITIWEIIDRTGLKCFLNHVQMTQGLQLEKGQVKFIVRNMATEFFGITYSIRRQLGIIKSNAENADVLGYYTIALDNWFHRALNVNKHLIFAFFDYVVQWVQWYVPTENFIVVSDHGFDPDKREHTNNAFYFSRKPGEMLNGIKLTNIAGMLLDHIGTGLKQSLGMKIKREGFNFSLDEKRELFKAFAAMGYR